MKALVSVDEWIRLIAPRRCHWCASAATEDGVCAGCRAQLPWNRTQCPGCALPQPTDTLCRFCLRRAHRFDSAWAPFVLAAPVQQAIHGLKYAAQFGPARALAALMAELLVERDAALPDLLLSVPLHRGRQFRRGYNQAQELARTLARSLVIAIDATAVQRIRATPDQIGLKAAARRRNLRGAFRVRRDLSGLHVALLDDVMTTGATLDELARAVRAAGATRIEAWALARAP